MRVKFLPHLLILTMIRTSFLLAAAATSLVLGENRCGSTYADASGKCGQACPDGLDGECPTGESCFADLNPLSCTNRCGTDFTNAAGKCGDSCPNATDGECPSGEKCFASLTSDVCNTESTTVNRCGTSATEASCGQLCPGGLDGECETGQQCFGGFAADEDCTVTGECPMQTYMGYYASWATTRACQSMQPNEIDPTPYTHLVFSFAKISAAFELEPYFADDVPKYEPFNALKTKKPSLKTLIAVGGWTFNDPGETQTLFSDTASTDANRKTFAQSAVAFLRQYKFDGLDIDWEYPGSTERGGVAADRDNLPLLLQELRTAFDAAPEKFVLSIAAPMSAYYFNSGYDLAKIHPLVDHINLMAYDFHGAFDLATSPKVDFHTNLDEMKAAFDLYKSAPSSKLNLGLAAYGRSFKLSDPACTTPGCGFTAGGSAGSCTKAEGTLSYAEIVEMNITPTNGPNGAYGVYDTDSWVGFDSLETMQAKVDLAKSLSLGGVMAWSIDQDSKTAPLLSSLNLYVSCTPAPVESDVPSPISTETPSISRCNLTQ